MKSEEIAKLAGVSRSTVSRVINGYKNVPAATREKVLRIIEENNYVPNSFARTLAGKKSNTIGLFFIVKEGQKSRERIFKNEFFTTYLELLVDHASLRNYYVLVSLISDNSDYDRVSQAFLEKRIDGGILIGTQEDTLCWIKAENITVPLVIFDYQLNEEEKERYSTANITVMNSNDEAGITEAVTYLVKNGHREIGFIKGNEKSRSGLARYKTYQKTMEKYGLIIQEDYILEGNFSKQVAYNEVKKVIEAGKLPTAFICANDSMATGAIAALHERGLSIPKDISIIGVDNISQATEIVPKLTTIAPDYREMAGKAIEILDYKIHKTKIVPEELNYGVNFIVRESSGPCPNQ